MKKVLCLALSLFLCLTLFALPAMANADESDSINDHLVSHYDFEGSNVAEQLADKAGDVKISLGTQEDLGRNQNGGLGTLAGGTYTKSYGNGASNQKLVAQKYLQDDTELASALMGDFTNVVRFKANAELSSYTYGDGSKNFINLVDARGWGLPQNRVFIMGYSAINNVFTMSVANTAGKESSVVSSVAVPEGTEGEWITVVATCKNIGGEGDAAVWCGTLMYKIGDDGLWYTSSAVMTEGARPAIVKGSNCELLVLGECKLDVVSVDDIKFYDVSVSEKDLTDLLGGKGIVSHYDFEGADLTEQLSDKAGTYKNNLTVNQTQDWPQLTIENGIFTKPGNSDSSNANKGSHKLLGTNAAIDTDIADAIEGDFTWILRIRANADLKTYTGGALTIIDLRYWATNHAFQLTYDAATNKFNAFINDPAGNRTGSAAVSSAALPETVNGEWITLAVTCKNVAAEGQTPQWDGSILYRVGNAEAWVSNTGTFCTAERTALTANNQLIILGECLGDVISIDDIKLYNAALDEATLSAFVPAEEDEGDGNEGEGNEGAGNEGDGNEGAGNEGAGNEGAGNEGDGNEGDGNEGDGTTVTEAPTTEPAATEAPATEAPTTEAPATEKKGCSGSMSAISLAMILLVGCGAGMVAKKRRNDATEQ